MARILCYLNVTIKTGTKLSPRNELIKILFFKLASPPFHLYLTTPNLPFHLKTHTYTLNFDDEFAANPL